MRMLFKDTNRFEETKDDFFSSTVFIKIEVFVLILDVLQIYFSFLIKLQIVNGGILFLIYFLCLAITCLYIPKIFSLNK